MKLRDRHKKEAAAERISAEEKGILSVNFIDSYIGYGVFALETIEKGKLVCFYEGTLISAKDGMKKLLTEKEDEGSFLFFFHHKDKHHCIDATHSTGCGRMINDSHLAPNCKVVAEEGPKLAVYTIKKIVKGEELRYDYKDTSAFWRREAAVKV